MTGRSEDIRSRLLATFRTEAQEHLHMLTADLAGLRRGLTPAETRDVIESAFREMHTLKGAARSVSLMEAEALCQACETILSRLARGHLSLTTSLLDALQEAVDGVAGLVAGQAGKPVTDVIARLERTAAGSVSEASTPGEAPEAPRARPGGSAHFFGLPWAETIRVATAKLDALQVLAEDLLVAKLAAAERAREARTLADVVTECRKVLDWAQAAVQETRAAGRGHAPADLDPTLHAVEARAGEVLDRLTRDHRVLAGIVDGLLDELRRLRMTPASTVLDLFSRMVRELARDQGKQVEFEVQGAGLEVDRRVLEMVKDPLIHLIRNAVDHGVEPPEVRIARGKPAQGRVTVTVAPLENGRIEIGVEDDGHGIDLAQVKKAAMRARLLTSEEAEAMNDDGVLQLVYRSGLSTSPIITDVSGHGLGLPIVKERVESLGGQIILKTTAGSGTAVKMRLPATISTFRGLLVAAGGKSFLLPLDAVVRVVRVAADAVHVVESREAIRWDGRPLIIAPLARLLALPEPDTPSAVPAGRLCVVVRSGEEMAGLTVDDVQGDREVLVKELKPPLVRVRNVTGAGLLGTGEVVLILRAADLLKAARQARPAPASPAAAEQETRARTILVVDDSITTRTMEKNLLEAAGYQVKTAVDGVDAWTVLKSEHVDLIVSDVDMPRLDGFDLTARIRGDPGLAGLPVVLVTALESREHKERGIEVGANAYVVKSSFDESNLLEIIRRLA